MKEQQLGYKRQKDKDWLWPNLRGRDRDAQVHQTGRRDGAPPSHPIPLPEWVILTFLVKPPQCLSCVQVIDIKSHSLESLHLLHHRIHLSNSPLCLYSIRRHPIRLHVTSADPRYFLSRLLTLFPCRPPGIYLLRLYLSSISCCNASHRGSFVYQNPRQATYNTR
jgi:hypothetical protein